MQTNLKGKKRTCGEAEIQSGESNVASKYPKIKDRRTLHETLNALINVQAEALEAIKARRKDAHQQDPEPCSREGPIKHDTNTTLHNFHQLVLNAKGKAKGKGTMAGTTSIQRVSCGGYAASLGSIADSLRSMPN